MERRYLVATLALAATFAIFSREFRSGHLKALPCSKAELLADFACAKEYVADQLVAKVQPFMHRGGPEEAQMVAELNLPVLAAVNERVAEAQAAVAQKTAEKKCDAAARAQENARRAQEATERAQEMRARAAERAQELSDRANARAQELSLRTNERAMKINARAIERAQRISACAMERAQRALDRSRSRTARPRVESFPIPINFEAPSPSDFVLPMQAALQSRLAVESVKARVAAQQFRVVTVQRANQKMMNDVQVVVTTQDVSGLGSLTQSSAARTVSRQIEHAIQHFLQNILRTIERTFAAL